MFKISNAVFFLSTILFLFLFQSFFCIVILVRPNRFLFWNVSFRYCFEFLFHTFFFLCRRVMCTRRPCRLWFTLFLAQHPITLKCGRPPRPLTATSVKACCGVLHGRACAAQSVGSNATKNARSSSMLTVYKVSHPPNMGKISRNVSWSCKVFATIDYSNLEAFQKHSNLTICLHCCWWWCCHIHMSMMHCMYACMQYMCNGFLYIIMQRLCIITGNLEIVFFYFFIYTNLFFSSLFLQFC